MFLDERSIPLTLSQIDYADRVAQLEENIPSGVPTVVIAILPEFVHCIVIGEYDSQNGYTYLDPLHHIENGQVPNEKDFYRDYGVQLQDAWKYTFELTKK
jgi:hypothetical protein